VLQVNDLHNRIGGEKATSREGTILMQFEGLGGERTWLGRAQGTVPAQRKDYSISVLFVKELLVSGFGSVG